MKRVIGILLIITIIIIITLILMILILNSSKTVEEESYKMYEHNDNNTTIDYNFKEVTNRDDYFVISSIVDEYLSNILIEDKSVIYNMIDKQYIDKYKISTENINDYIDSIDAVQIFKAKKMYVRKQDTNKNVYDYFVYGTIREDDRFIRKEEKNFKIIVKIDSDNTTFSIIPQKYIDDNKYNDINNIQLENETIKENTDNLYRPLSIDDKVMVNLLFSDYKDNMLYNSEQAYNNLSEKYREIRFGGIETYNKYIDGIKEEISELFINKFSINKYDDFTEYICIDQYNNYYIFKETAVMQYTLQLDTYTIESEKFIQEYNASDDREKTMMNIDKWIKMLNNRDYIAAYNVLDKTFRENTFGSEEKFEQYMKSNFPLHYGITFDEYSDETGVNVQKIKLKDITGNETNNINVDIIMKLNSNTDFVMSFNIE